MRFEELKNRHQAPAGGLRVTLPAAREVADGEPFAAERLAQLARIEPNHFWFVGRRELILRLLATHLPDTSAPILDLGCGTGHFLRILASHGYRVAGLDARPEGLEVTRRLLPEAQLIQGDAARLPFASASFGAVLLLDLLEHVDDRAVLAEVSRVLRPGGIAILTVPAFPALWSYRDDAAGHRRRYSRHSLARALADARLEIDQIRYYQCLLFPLVVGTRLLGRRRAGMRDLEERPMRQLNSVLTQINLLEVRLGSRIRWPWGSSLVAVGRKP